MSRDLEAEVLAATERATVAEADLRRLRVQQMLALSVHAGDAGLWGNVIRHAAIDAALAIADGRD